MARRRGSVKSKDKKSAKPKRTPKPHRPKKTPGLKHVRIGRKRGRVIVE